MVGHRKQLLRYGPAGRVPDHEKRVVRALLPAGLSEGRSEEKLPREKVGQFFFSAADSGPPVP